MSNLRRPHPTEQPWMTVALTNEGERRVLFHESEAAAMSWAKQNEVREIYVAHITAQGAAPMSNLKRST